MENTASPQECGVGIRGVAMAIDSGVWFVLLFVATYPIAAITGNIQTTASGTQADLTGIPAMVALLLWFGLALGYHTLLEWRFGKTIGKYLVSIKATADDGTPLSFRSSLVRNVARLIDFLPFFYLVGILLLLWSDRYKRLGDRVAETVVSR